MADAELNCPPTSRKRSHDGELLSPASPFQAAFKLDNESPSGSRERSPSMALSTASSSLTELTSISTLNPNPADPSGPQVKKRKLTFAEKEVEKAVRRREKEEKAKAKEDEKARREDEKRVRDEEKRRKAEERDAIRRVKEVEKAEKEATRQAKDAERAEKQKAKDAEKEEKEAEKAKKEAEKLKKERAQMRIGAFFGRPAPASTPPSTPDDGSTSNISSRRSSMASIDVGKPVLETTSPNATNPDYGSWILPFFPHEHTVVAPLNRFSPRGTASLYETDQPPFEITSDDALSPIEPISRRFPASRRRIRKIMPVKEIMTILNGSENAPIDLTGDFSLAQDVAPLERISYKIISFFQDVRPPYQGTYTRAVSPRSSRKLARNPTCRDLPDTNYDYDSEAEWQEPEPDDEDLGEEDEMSEDEDDADEIDDFLDDADDISKRKLIAADVDPVCTGLCWEGASSHMVGGVDLSAYRMDVLHDSTNLPIDPYSGNHWAQSNKTPLIKAEKQLAPSASPAMQPPRLPLSSVSAPNVSPLRAFVTGVKTDGEAAQQENKQVPPKARGRPANPNKPVKIISADVLPAFRAAVEGSDLNKVALIEILKKKFSKCSKDAIKDTLSTIAVRQGVKEVDKRWVLIA